MRNFFAEFVYQIILNNLKLVTMVFQPKKKIGTRAEPEKFNMVKAGARRRELGAKANATEAELREYKDLINQIEAELEKKFKADEKKV